MIVANPNTRKEVEVEGAKFTVGIVPYGKRVELESMALGNVDAKTREGYRGILLQNLEFVRWGIKGHVGLRFQESADELPFKAEKVKLGDREYDVVSEEIMDVYSATPGLIIKLAAEVTKLNYASGEERKN